jgi:deazaflavin-dependent oxidoreductase (nitroreductase family)
VSHFSIDPTRECIEIVTKGRRTGREHRVEIWFGILDGDVCLLSGNGPGADWFRNALADPRVTIDVDGAIFVGRARVAHSGKERAAIGALMRAKYPWEGDPSIGLTFDAWCDEVPALVITRVD